MKYLTVNTQ